MELPALIRDLPERERDPALSRRRIIDALVRNPDPILREIGGQLRAGTMTPRDLLREPAYARIIERGLRRLRETDPVRLADALRARRTQAGRSPNRHEG